MPISSIANVLYPAVNNYKISKNEVHEYKSIKYHTKFNIKHDYTLDANVNQEQDKIDNTVKNYECEICGKIFFKRTLIIRHFRTSLCFPESPKYLENSSENSMFYINDTNILVTNNVVEDNKCNFCKTAIILQNDNLTPKRKILYTNKSSHFNKNKGQWECKLCGTLFKKISSLKSHELIYFENKISNNNKCIKSYNDLDLFKKHEIIKKKNIFRCHICQKYFTSKLCLSKHVRRIHNDLSKNYECSKCSKIYHKRCQIINHIFMNHQEDYSKYCCSVCLSSQESNSQKQINLTNKMFKCDVCPKSFATSYKLYLHYKWHLGINNFKCLYCSKAFSKYSVYLSHDRTHINKKLFKCNFCEKWFIISYNLHTHTQTRYKPFKCDICQNSFARMSSLLSHKKIHMKDKQFNCRNCKKSFSQSKTLKLHIRQQHTRENPYKCRMCSKSFTLLSMLNLHLKTHSGEQIVKCEICYEVLTKSSLEKHKWSHMNSNSFKCELCDETFPNLNILMAHKKMHSEYECKICQKTFINNMSSLKRHYKKIHKINKPFQCDTCEMSFVHSSSLDRHKKRHLISEENNMHGINETKKNCTNKEYKCDLCSKIFNDQSQIFTHILVTHY